MNWGLSSQLGIKTHGKHKSISTWYPLGSYWSFELVHSRVSKFQTMCCPNNFQTIWQEISYLLATKFLFTSRYLWGLFKKHVFNFYFSPSIPFFFPSALISVHDFILNYLFQLVFLYFSYLDTDFSVRLFD